MRPSKAELRENSLQTASDPRPYCLEVQLDRLGKFAGRYLKALGRAYLDGIIAYGAAMYGVTVQIDEDASSAPPLVAPVWLDPRENMAEAPFRSVDELFAWLETQGDRNPDHPLTL